MKQEKKKGHLSQFERDRIEILLKAGHKQCEIAGVLNRDPGTISRELKRNPLEKDSKKSKKGEYKAELAGIKTKERRKNAKYQGKKINENNELKEYIIDKLENGCNPDEISGRMKEENKTFYASKTTIYEWLYSIWGQKYCKHLKSKRYDPKKRKVKKEDNKKSPIPFRMGIELRPSYVDNLLFFGHWEGDTIVSGKKTGSKYALVVLVERTTKTVSIRKIRSLKPSLFNRAVKNIARDNKIESLTLDNGIENKHHYKLGIDTYFCDPYSSWQKGMVENMNKMIRYYIPKGSDISKYSNGYIKMVEDILNNKPRKILNYKTANECYNLHVN